MFKTLLLLSSLVLLLPNFFNKDIIASLPYDGKENFDPNLSYLNSINKLSGYIDSIATEKKTPSNSFEYVQIVVTAIRYRFFHGFSHFAMNENWIAALSGKYIEIGLGCKVQPEDIMQHSNAACSQQALVMMAVLRNKNITYRNIGFPHHYAIEVLIDNTWFFFDTNMEPIIPKEQRMASYWKYQPDRLKQFYDHSRFMDLDYKFGIGLTATRGKINELPALNARIFHSCTWLLSKIAWCFPLLLLLYRPAFSFKAPFSIRLAKKNAPPSLAV